MAKRELIGCGKRIEHWDEQRREINEMERIENELRA